MPWYTGPTVVEVLDGFAPPTTNEALPLRFPVQDVYKFDERRIIAGRVESGRLKVGDELLFSPAGRTARVASIEAWQVPSPPGEAAAGQSIGITLTEQLFVERGHMAGHVQDAPVQTNLFRARLFWLGRKALEVGSRFKLKLATAEHQVEVQAIERVIDIEDLSTGAGTRVERNGIGEVVLRARATLSLDDFTRNPRTGRFVLVDGYDTVGGGIVSMEGLVDQRTQFAATSQNIRAVEHRIDRETRARANGHEAGILWLTGLSGAGKSTLATVLEQRLFHKGYQVYVLDGDNMRFGLSADLGFAPEDRAENIRRAGEVAKLFADAGFLVVTAFISPYRADRDRVRAIAPELFHEVYVRADLSVCEARDPKGLYKKARAGQIAEFTGISAPYEAHEHAELEVDTGTMTVEESVAALVAYVSRNFGDRNGHGEG